MEEYFSDLASHYKSLVTTESGMTFKISTGDVSLNIETGMPLGIITAELITSSLKYGHTQDKL